jgi:hypothetical protein
VAETKSAAVEHQIRDLDEVLASALPRRPVSFSSLLAPSAPPRFEHGALAAGNPSPDWVDFAPADPKGLARIFGGKSRHDREVAAARVRFEVAVQAHAQAETAGKRALANVRFRVGTARLETVPESFDVILSRHAPFDLEAIAAHLQPGGYFITQQVGERNMACVKAVLGQREEQPGKRAIQRQAFTASGLRLLASGEYDVEYVVRDIESLLFWLGGLDRVHADLDGPAALASAAALNRVLAGNVGERGFVTNEHRYVAVATAAGR